MAGRLLFARTFLTARCLAAAAAWLLPAIADASADGALPVEAPLAAATVSTGLRPDEATEGILSDVRPRYGFPGDAEGLPSDAELVQNGAVIGTVEIDNQNIFNLADPKDNNGVFRLADKLHVKTRARTVRNNLLLQARRPVLASPARRVGAHPALAELLLRRLDPCRRLPRQQGRREGDHA